MFKKPVMRWFLPTFVLSMAVLILITTLTSTYETYAFQHVWLKDSWTGKEAVFRDAHGLFRIRLYLKGPLAPFFTKESELVTDDDSKQERVKMWKSESFYVRDGKIIESNPEHGCVVEAGPRFQAVLSRQCSERGEKDFANTKYTRIADRSIALVEYKSSMKLARSTSDSWSPISHSDFIEAAPVDFSKLMSSFTAPHRQVVALDRKINICKLFFESCPSLESDWREAMKIQVNAWDGF